PPAHLVSAHRRGGGGAPAPRPPASRGERPHGPSPRLTNKTPAPDAPRTMQTRSTPHRPGNGARGAASFATSEKRLSATDISALASMKNVAKCDTWCELQNPVNHRVFERKLRPKPSGRGHVCLGVTQRRPPRQTRSRHGADAGRGGGIWPPVISTSSRLPQREGPGDGGRDDRWLTGPREQSRRTVPGSAPKGPRVPFPRSGGRTLRSRPQVRRDHPLSLSISISGGKETYQDSPSNGERTGKSPA